MPDTSTQLREYFDQVVERITEDDIRIRANTARGIPVRVPRFRIHPVASLATGFGIAMTLLGGVMVAAEILGGEPSDVGGGSGAPGGSTVTDPGNLWPLLWLMLGFGLLALGMWSMRRSAGDVRERGDEGMQTIERPGAAEAPPGDITKLKGRNRMLTWLVGILAVAVIGLAAWLIVEMSSSGGTGSLPAEVEAALDNYNRAWEDRDGEAFLEATANNYAWDDGGARVVDRYEQADIIENYYRYFKPDVIDTMVVGDDGYNYYVAQSMRVQFREGGPQFEGVSTYKLVNVNGAWKVRLHTWMGERP